MQPTQVATNNKSVYFVIDLIVPLLNLQVRGVSPHALCWKDDRVVVTATLALLHCSTNDCPPIISSAKK